MYSMEDGLLLKPTRPAMSLDSTFTQRAFGEGGPRGQLWAGYTVLKDSLVSITVLHTYQCICVCDCTGRCGTSFWQLTSHKNTH